MKLLDKADPRGDYCRVLEFLFRILILRGHATLAAPTSAQISKLLDLSKARTLIALSVLQKDNAIESIRRWIPGTGRPASHTTVYRCLPNPKLIMPRALIDAGRAAALEAFIEKARTDLLLFQTGEHGLALEKIAASVPGPNLPRRSSYRRPEYRRGG